MDDPTELRVIEEKQESIWHFWKWMGQSGGDLNKPRAVKLLYAVPASSAHIERDFSVARSMVTSQRTRLSPQNIDMATFLNRNSKLVDLAQCQAIPSSEIGEHVPASMTFPIEIVPDEFGEDLITDLFASTSLDGL